MSNWSSNEQIQENDLASAAWHVDVGLRRMKTFTEAEVKVLVAKACDQTAIKMIADQNYYKEHGDWPDDCGVDYDVIVDRVIAEAKRRHHRGPLAW